MKKHTIKNDTKIIYEIKHSKFICYAFSVNSEISVKDKEKELKKEYADATHICYAYKICNGGVFEKAIDDGEPSQTAGKPILEVIKKKKLDNVVVFVVRYFGGIKLGAGGLIRAYAHATRNALECAETQPIVNYCTISVSIDYSMIDSFKNHFKAYDYIIINQSFDCIVKYDIKCDKDDEGEFLSWGK